MLKKYIITLIVGAVLSALSYAADNGGLPIPLLLDLRTNAEAEDAAVVEVPLLAVVQPPEPDDKNIVAEGPDLVGGGAYMHCPRENYHQRRSCRARWSCRGPLRRMVFWPLRRLFGRRC